MRRILALSALVVLLAGGAGAQSTSQSASPSLRGSQPAASSTGLTSASQTADGQAAPNDTAAASVSALSGGLAGLAPAPLMSPLPATGFGDGAQQCRTACARSHYFCIAAGDDLEECASAWAQCAARCNRPAV